MSCAPPAFLTDSLAKFAHPPYFPHYLLKKKKQCMWEKKRVHMKQRDGVVAQRYVEEFAEARLHDAFRFVNRISHVVTGKTKDLHARPFTIKTRCGLETSRPIPVTSSGVG